MIQIRNPGAIVDVASLKDSANMHGFLEDARTYHSAGWKSEVQGYPVSTELEALLTGFLEHMPTAKIHPKTTSSNQRCNGGYVTCLSEVYIYLDDCPVTLGAIGYKDYAVGKAHFSYGVTSVNIHNEKYAPHRAQRNITLSDKLDKAVKNALKYIRPFTHQEIATVYYDQMFYRVRDHKAEPNSRLHKVMLTISNRDILYEELAYLNSLGIQFKTTAFQQAASKIQELAEEARESEARKVNGIFVRIRTVGEDRYADVVTATNIDKNSVPLFGGSTGLLVQELPEELVGKISTLSILEDGGYVSRVGQRINEYMYWVEQDREIM